jgi:hypothetical protein
MSRRDCPVSRVVVGGEDKPEITLCRNPGLLDRALVVGLVNDRKLLDRLDGFVGACVVVFGLSMSIGSRALGS